LKKWDDKGEWNTKATVYVTGDWLHHISQDGDQWGVVANMVKDVRVLLETWYILNV
jgi:hypothetical protein